MDCTAHCASVAPGDGGGLGAGKESGEEEEEEGSGESLQQQGAWHRWLKINTDPASDWA